MRTASRSLAIAILAARVAIAQAPPSSPPEKLAPVKAEVVRVDVVVKVKGNRPRLGLTQKDFVVLEDGQPQPIVRFEEFASLAAASSATRSAPRPARHVALLVDDNHIHFSNLGPTKKALKHFLESDLSPDDWVSLATTCEGSALEFTTDRQVLKEAVERFLLPDRKAVDPEALGLAAKELQDERPSTPDPANEARTVAHQAFAESMRDSRNTLETIENLVRALGRLPGRKIVVLASDGFPIGPGLLYDLQRVTDAATRAGVVIYSLHTGGLVGIPQRYGGAAARGIPLFFREPILARLDEQGMRDGIHALAVDTGGLLVEDSNDLAPGLREILKDTEHYYAIAYEPTNARRDGAFRTIEVRLPGMSGVKIRARKGYYAPDDRIAPLGDPRPSTATATRPPPDPRVDALKAALASSAVLTDLPVRASADFASQDGVVTQVLVSGHVDVRAVAFVRSGDRHRATVDVTGALYDENDRVVSVLDVERAALDVPTASYDLLLERGLRYRKAVALKPGRYRMRLAVREDTEGKVGSVTQTVEVPDLATGKLALSGVFMSKEEETDTKGAPPESEDAVSLRKAHALHFLHTDTLYAQVFAYNAGRDGSGASNLAVHAEIWHDGSRLAATPVEPMPQGERDSPPIPYTRSFRLEAFAPGEYEVRMLVTDRLAAVTASGRAAFTVE